MVQERLGYVIKRTQQVLRLRMDKELIEAGITTPQYAALSVLEEDQGLSNAELARRCFLRPQTMHKIVTGLEDKGFIERKSDPSHGRKIKTKLTPEGMEVLANGHKIVKQIEAEMTRNLSPKQIKETADRLEMCIDVLQTDKN